MFFIGFIAAMTSVRPMISAYPLRHKRPIRARPSANNKATFKSTLEKYDSTHYKQTIKAKKNAIIAYNLYICNLDNGDRYKLINSIFDLVVNPSAYNAHIMNDVIEYDIIKGFIVPEDHGEVDCEYFYSNSFTNKMPSVVFISSLSQNTIDDQEEHLIIDKNVSTSSLVQSGLFKVENDHYKLELFINTHYGIIRCTYLIYSHFDEFFADPEPFESLCDTYKIDFV